MSAIQTCAACGKAGWVTFAGSIETVTHIQRTDHPFSASRSGSQAAAHAGRTASRGPESPSRRSKRAA